MAMHEVFIQLGSNMGSRTSALRNAMQALQEILGEPLKVSAVYESQAWGKSDQQHFLNQVALFKTSLSPAELLSHLKDVEKAMGRIPFEKWGPRIIDLDILFYKQLVYYSQTLQIPHPHIPQRAFVLIPLLEIAPDLKHPLLGKTILEIQRECKDPLWVKMANIAP